MSRVKTTSARGVSTHRKSNNGANAKEDGNGRRSFFWILAADDRGACLAPTKGKGPPPRQNPRDEHARQIAFHRRSDADGEVPRDQLEFREGAERLLHVIRHLYPEGDPSAEARFRQRYLEIFNVSGLVLEERSLGVETGKAELESIGKDLVHDEGPRVKNARLWRLVRLASYFAIPVALGYGALSYVLAHRHGVAYRSLLGLHVEPTLLANYLLLWLGVFLGVCVSYALRKPTFTVDDLVATTEDDLLLPQLRLLFAGTLTMLLAMLSARGFFDVEVGALKLSAVEEPNGYTAAFLAGVVCGISERLLPSIVLSRTAPKTD